MHLSSRSAVGVRGGLEGWVGGGGGELCYFYLTAPLPLGCRALLHISVPMCMCGAECRDRGPFLLQEGCGHSAGGWKSAKLGFGS